MKDNLKGCGKKRLWLVVSHHFFADGMKITEKLPQNIRSSGLGFSDHETDGTKIWRRIRAYIMTGCRNLDANNH
jgi:hypothetical protein